MGSCGRAKVDRVAGGVGGGVQEGHAGLRLGEVGVRDSLLQYQFGSVSAQSSSSVVGYRECFTHRTWEPKSGEHCSSSRFRRPSLWCSLTRNSSIWANRSRASACQHALALDVIT